MNVKSIVIASAAATLLLTGAVGAQAAEKEGGDKVRCAGVNECKGKGGCHTASNACAGSNGCKGQGIVMMDKAECEKKGGKVAPDTEKK
jgi:hypothetical protein